MLISPSLLSVERKKIALIVDELINLKVKYIHIDVMDKGFIGHTAIKISDFKKISGKKIKYGIHLMVNNPRKYAKKFIALGAKTIIFHYESFSNNMSIAKFISDLHVLNVKVGIAFKPNTKIEDAFFFIKMVDIVLIMTVEPGKGGQTFNKKMLKKIKICSEYIKKNNLKTSIEVDGGINNKTCIECWKNGVNILVIGSYLFNGASIKKQIDSISNIYREFKNFKI
ncbi:MAG: ribulose-phosphate 3-epimerase [Bacilli bacterium]|nr:ribulose-phosphate 3-epimerase [Bacilli bacterium]